jgi:hypothetical protein
LVNCIGGIFGPLNGDFNDGMYQAVGEWHSGCSMVQEDEMFCRKGGLGNAV